jgi:superfamily II RNA helicase
VVDEKGNFRQDNFDRAMSGLIHNDAVDDSAIARRKKKSNSKGSTSDLFRIVRYMIKLIYHVFPAILFYKFDDVDL